MSKGPQSMNLRDYGSYGDPEVTTTTNLRSFAAEDSVRKEIAVPQKGNSTDHDVNFGRFWYFHYRALILSISVTQPEEAEKPQPKSSFFSFAFDGFAEEVEASKKVEESKLKAQVNKPTIISNPKTGQAHCKTSVAHQVVNDDQQWKQLQAQMRKNGGRTSLLLKHNLNGMLQDRVADLEEKGQGHETAIHKPKRTSIADFASSLIRGDDSQKQKGPLRHSVSAVGAGPQPKQKQRLSVPLSTAAAVQKAVQDLELSDFDDDDDDQPTNLAESNTVQQNKFNTGTRQDTMESVKEDNGAE